MRKLARLFLLCGSSLHLFAGDMSHERLQTIEARMKELQREKVTLRGEVKAEEHREMFLEMQGQQEFVGYEWHSGSEHLKAAQAQELSSEAKIEKVRNIDRQLAELAAEKDALLKEKR